MFIIVNDLNSLQTNNSINFRVKKKKDYWQNIGSKMKMMKWRRI